MNTPIPQEIILHKISRTLELIFDDNTRFILPYAVLRAASTSAEMRHSEHPIAIDPHVTILSIEPVGHYAIKPVFSDGHRTGIYSWETLHQLGVQHAKK